MWEILMTIVEFMSTLAVNIVLVLAVMVIALTTIISFILVVAGFIEGLLGGSWWALIIGALVLSVDIGIILTVIDR